jgi:hypothetical protein
MHSWCTILPFYRGADKSLARPPREIIDQIHELILEDSRISAKSTAEQLGISREQVGSINHEDLDRLVTCFLPGRAKDLSAPLYKERILCDAEVKDPLIWIVIRSEFEIFSTRVRSVSDSSFRYMRCQ